MLFLPKQKKALRSQQIPKAIEESVYYHTQTMTMMHDIASMLQQQAYTNQQPSQQPPYMPQQPAPMQSPPSFAQQSNKMPEKRQIHPTEESENDYKAQFKRPDPQKKNRPTTKDGLIENKVRIINMPPKTKTPPSEEGG